MAAGTFLIVASFALSFLAPSSESSAFEVDVAVRSGTLGRLVFGREARAESAFGTLVFRLRNVPEGVTRVRMLDVREQGGVFRLGEARAREFLVPPPSPLRGMQRLIDVPISRLNGLEPGKRSRHQVWFVTVGARSVASPAVTLRYEPPAQDPLGPHPVRITFERVRAVAVQESGAFSDGDEPYFLATVHVLDHPGYEPTRPNLATVREALTVGAQGNLGLKRVASARSIALPAGSSWEIALNPVRGSSADESARSTLAVLTVFWMEEDASPASAIQELLRLGLAPRLRFYLQDRARESRGVLDTGRLREASQAAAESILRDWGTAGDSETNPFRRWASYADPDDLVGVATMVFSLQDLLQAGDRGLPIDMLFRGDGAHYELVGTVRYAPPR